MMLMNGSRAQEHLEHARLTALVATAPENVTYVSDPWAMSQWIRRGPHAYAGLPAAPYGPPCIVASTGGLDLVADQRPWVTDVRRYGFIPASGTRVPCRAR